MHEYGVLMMECAYYTLLYLTGIFNALGVNSVL